jgi:hypothetical protein
LPFIKLYAFHPSGHGKQTFLTLASNVADARHIVDEYVQKKYVHDGRLAFQACDCGTDYYTRMVAEPGEVIENDNE